MCLAENLILQMWLLASASLKDRDFQIGGKKQIQLYAVTRNPFTYKDASRLKYKDEISILWKYLKKTNTMVESSKL